MRFVWGVAVFLASVMTAPASAENLVLQPNSDWVVDYAEDSCALRRNFGGHDDFVQLEIRYFSPGGLPQISVVGKGLSTTGDDLQFRFEPDNSWRTAPDPAFADYSAGFRGVFFDAPIYSLSNQGRAEASTHLVAEHKAKRDAFLKMVTGLTVKGAFKRQITLQTGSLFETSVAIDTCLQELLSHWGIDVARHQSISREVEAKNSKAVARLVDFPRDVTSPQETGRVRVRMAVDENGHATGCHVQQKLNNPAFERETCAALMRMKFEPALDGEGRPMASFWLTRVYFR